MGFDIRRMLQREFNVGKYDQKIRICAGIVMMVLASRIDSGTIMLLGLAIVVSGMLRWCPAYSAMSKSTVQEGEAPPIF
ncbi:MAG: DUF2892 domain-containing protein [Methylococcaceae bacterium]|jgi:hypothetical protein